MLQVFKFMLDYNCQGKLEKVVLSEHHGIRINLYDAAERCRLCIF